MREEQILSLRSAISFMVRSIRTYGLMTIEHQKN